mmetsp:Transcript_45104/g.45672  ORF Transcript_45104/g.45672 Transcript_45104/m.45672 type:complete len:126 (+) Transcript_45104:269-646(+)
MSSLLLGNFTLAYAMGIIAVLVGSYVNYVYQLWEKAFSSEKVRRTNKHSPSHKQPPEITRYVRLLMIEKRAIFTRNMRVVCHHTTTTHNNCVSFLSKFIDSIDLTMLKQRSCHAPKSTKHFRNAN